MKTKRYPCPKCGKKYMWKSNKTPGGRQRWVCATHTSGQQEGGERKEYCYSTTNPEKPVSNRSNNEILDAPRNYSRKLRIGVKRYLITAAQNATPVHAKFWGALLVAAKHMNAEIMVVPLRYKNPTSIWAKSQENEEWWDPKVVPYLWNQRHAINSNLLLLADLKTQPTASSPLTGFEAITAGESGIIGHTKLQLKVIPAPSHKLPKILTTTGACTKPNYSDSKAGKLGEFHHSLGAVSIEAQGKTFHLRHISANARSGDFTDLESRYSDTGVERAPQPEALVMGDTHVDFIDPSVEHATFGKGGIVDTLNPKALVWHDLLDAYAVNPHHIGNPFNAYAKRQSGRDNAGAEVQRAIAFLHRRSRGRTSYVVSSNHDDFLRRWIVDGNWKTDPTNAEFYLRTALVMLTSTRMGTGGTESPSPFGYWINQTAGTNIHVVGNHRPLTLAGVELSMHGDRGPNGSRGSIRNLRRIGLRSIIGHSHSPGIDEGCMQVGTSTRLKLEYNNGPSSWLNAHAVLHADGKRQLIFIINGKWRMK